MRDTLIFLKRSAVVVFLSIGTSLGMPALAQSRPVASFNTYILSNPAQAVSSALLNQLATRSGIVRSTCDACAPYVPLLAEPTSRGRVRTTVPNGLRVDILSENIKSHQAYWAEVRYHGIPGYLAESNLIHSWLQPAVRIPFNVASSLNFGGGMGGAFERRRCGPPEEETAPRITASYGVIPPEGTGRLSLREEIGTMNSLCFIGFAPSHNLSIVIKRPNSSLDFVGQARTDVLGAARFDWIAGLSPLGIYTVTATQYGKVVTGTFRRFGASTPRIAIEPSTVQLGASTTVVVTGFRPHQVMPLYIYNTTSQAFVSEFLHVTLDTSGDGSLPLVTQPSDPRGSYSVVEQYHGRIFLSPIADKNWLDGFSATVRVPPYSSVPGRVEKQSWDSTTANVDMYASLADHGFSSVTLWASPSRNARIVAIIPVGSAVKVPGNLSPDFHPVASPLAICGHGLEAWSLVTYRGRTAYIPSIGLSSTGTLSIHSASCAAYGD